MNEVAAEVKNVVNKLNISSESFAIQLTVINKLSKAGLEISQENIDKIQEIVDNQSCVLPITRYNTLSQVKFLKVSKVKKKANQLVPGDVVAGFHGNRRVLTLPFAARQHGQKKASILLQNVETGVKSHVLWGFHTPISMVSIAEDLTQISDFGTIHTHELNNKRKKMI